MWLRHVKQILVVEASDGQLEDELLLALAKADVDRVPIRHLRHMGGILPADDEIYGVATSIMEAGR